MPIKCSLLFLTLVEPKNHQTTRKIFFSNIVEPLVPPIVLPPTMYFYARVNKSVNSDHIPKQPQETNPHLGW